MNIMNSFEVRTKEEVFESDYITLSELHLFGSFDEMYRQMREYAGIKDKEIADRFEILDL